MTGPPEEEMPTGGPALQPWSLAGQPGAEAREQPSEGSKNQKL